MASGEEYGVFRQSKAQRCTLWFSCSYVVWKRSGSSHIILVKEIEVNRVRASKPVMRVLLWGEDHVIDIVERAAVADSAQCPPEFVLSLALVQLTLGGGCPDRNTFLSHSLLYPHPPSLHLGGTRRRLFTRGVWMEVMHCPFWTEVGEKQLCFSTFSFPIQGPDAEAGPLQVW